MFFFSSVHSSHLNLRLVIGETHTHFHFHLWNQRKMKWDEAKQKNDPDGWKLIQTYDLAYIRFDCLIWWISKQNKFAWAFNDCVHELVGVCLEVSMILLYGKRVAKSSFFRKTWNVNQKNVRNSIEATLMYVWFI